MMERPDQIRLTCLLCGSPAEVRYVASVVIIRCIGPPGVLQGCGLRLERKGEVDDVIRFWEKGKK